MITLIKQKSDNKIKALARVYRAYKKRGWDISQVNLSKHTSENYRDNLQLIVYRDYIKNNLNRNRTGVMYALPRIKGIAVNCGGFFKGR